MNPSKKYETRLFTKQQTLEEETKQKDNSKPSCLNAEDEIEDLSVPLVPKSAINKLINAKGVEVISENPLILELASPKLLQLLTPDVDPALTFVYDPGLSVACREEIQMTCTAFHEQGNVVVVNSDNVAVNRFRGRLDIVFAGQFRLRSNIDKLLERLQAGTGLRALRALPAGTLLGRAIIIYANVDARINIYK